MALQQRLANSLDELSSSRTCLSRRTKALESLEQLLAETTSQGKISELNLFLKLQDSFDCNIASRVMYCVESVALVLDKLSNPVIVNEEDTDPEINAVSRVVSQSLHILQGVSLLHYQSKLFLGKKWCIQLLVDLLTISRHLSPSPPSASTNTRSVAQSNTMSLLASSLIDTILCVLVDAPPAIRAFEEVGGVEVVVKTLKQAGVPRDIRIKCLEFLYFYLLDETSEVPAIKPGLPVSRTNSLESVSPQKSSQQASRSPSPDATPRTPRKPRNLGLLRKELDFVPITPKKTQVLRLGVGSPHKATRTPLGKPGTGDVPPLPSSPTKHLQEVVTPSKREGRNQGEYRRTTQEKKEILAGLLGNVDTLVESVARSGIWGLG